LLIFFIVISVVAVKTFIVSAKKTKRAHSFEELHAKLEELKSVKKLCYKQKLLKKTLKNRIKKKTKKEERLLQRKLVGIEQNTIGGSKIKTENEEVPKVPKPKPVFNSEGKMVFSKFDFSEIGVKKKLPKSQNDPKKVLQQLQQKKEKLKQLENLGEQEKAEDIREKDAWKSALAKASGEKVCTYRNIYLFHIKNAFLILQCLTKYVIDFIYIFVVINFYIAFCIILILILFILYIMNYFMIVLHIKCFMFLMHLCYIYL